MKKTKRHKLREKKHERVWTKVFQEGLNDQLCHVQLKTKEISPLSWPLTLEI